jgi:anion-transporting  ArsA/GET3 family ATPase
MDDRRPPPAPLDRPLVFVTGKGGVGKSTVAAALGVIAARHGRRAIVAELARRDDVSRALGGDGAAGAQAERELVPGLFAISIDPELAMEEYLVDQLPVRTLAERLSSSRTFTYLAAATPGLRELLAMGKVWELAQPQRRTPDGEPYDLVIVDAPATGHGVAFLTAPRTFAAAAAVGPVARQARTIQTMIEDPTRTAVVAVARATEASVAETLQLRDDLRATLQLDIGHLVINALEPRRFDTEDLLALDALPGPDSPTPASSLATVAVRAARTALARSQAQQRSLARLRRHWDGPALTLPHLFAAELGPPEIAELSRTLERRL